MKYKIVLIGQMVLLSVMCFGQDSSNLSSRVALGAKFSSLGIGIEGAVGLTSRSNVRGAFNFFNYDRTFANDGVIYGGQLGWRSVQIVYDQYVFKGFHLSPGLLAYNGNHMDGSASVPPGQSFNLANVRYFSGQGNPITGAARMDFRKTAPMVLFGVGNPLPRSGRRFGFNVDAGIAFLGSPSTTLSFTGNACAISPTAGCVNAATDPTVQANVQAQQAKVNSDLKSLQYYPIISIGVSWRIK
jgi:hypothetical protein